MMTSLYCMCIYSLATCGAVYLCFDWAARA